MTNFPGYVKGVNDLKIYIFQLTILVLLCSVAGCNNQQTEQREGSVSSVPPGPLQAKEPLQQRMERLFPLVGVKLQSRQGHVFDRENVDQYLLDVVPAAPDQNAFVNSFGQFLQLGENKFKAHNSTMCGNDVSVVTKGTWKWVADKKVEIFVESIERNEYCSKPSEKPKKIFGVFELKWTNDSKTTLQLNRVDSP